MCKKKLVLIVEDEFDTANGLKKSLESEDAEYIIAYDGQKALEEINKKEIDLILLDIELPGINGLEVLEKLKEDKKTSNIPVIMVTSNNKESYIEKAFKLGAEEYIIKSFNTEILQDRVKKILWS